jgi:hypothetical protein
MHAENHSVAVGLTIGPMQRVSVRDGAGMMSMLGTRSHHANSFQGSLRVIPDDGDAVIRLQG